MWKEILKSGGSQGRRTKNTIHKSVKKLIIEFTKGKDSFEKSDLMDYIENNLVEQVEKDGELAKLINENQVARRTNAYLKMIDNYTTIWHKYLTMQGYNFNPAKRAVAGHRGGTFSKDELSKAKLPAVKTQKYRLYEAFIKRILKDEGGAAGMKNFTDAGNMINGFDERFLNYVISDALDHGDWLAEHEYGDFYLKE